MADELPVVLDIRAPVLLGIAADPGFNDLHAIGRGIEPKSENAVARPASKEQEPATIEADEPPVVHALRNASALQGLGFRHRECPGETQIFSLRGYRMRLPGINGGEFRAGAFACRDGEDAGQWQYHLRIQIACVSWPERVI